MCGISINNRLCVYFVVYFLWLIVLRTRAYHTQQNHVFVYVLAIVWYFFLALYLLPRHVTINELLEMLRCWKFSRINCFML